MTTVLSSQRCLRDRRAILRLAAILVSLGAPCVAQAPRLPAAGTPIPLDRTTTFQVSNTRLEWVQHAGRLAVHFAPLPGHEEATDETMSALLVDSDFTDGTIEVDVSGARRAGYAADNTSAHKGHIGLSFRVRGDTAERFYVRPENSILDDQLFRNRSVQYEADPDYSFNRLRQETPGVYESYAPMRPGAWTTLRIEVAGTKARLYVNGSAEPVLVVNDLKNGTHGGKIALWTRISTDAYFSNLRVEHR
jgi:3-keto-disaccharide hydrolase